MACALRAKAWATLRLTTLAAFALLHLSLAGAQNATPSGIVFQCSLKQLPVLQAAFEGYLFELGIEPDWVAVKTDTTQGTITFTASAHFTNTGTLNLIDQPGMGITEELVQLPTAGGAEKPLLTVAQKEIVLAMLQPGRTTLFSRRACDIQALQDHVAIRQNIVAWTEALEWKWPNGGAARWNRKYWDRGTPVKKYPLHAALNDVFIHQQKYATGCYTATKLVMVQAVLDYFRRIKKDPATLALVEARLLKGGEPLSFIEPGAMWQFESDSTPADLVRPGKLLGIRYGVPAHNFIPGDWAYFLNTDPVTAAKTGYEGSNAIYLGRGKFDDFYNDHHHYYTYKEKLHEVYQWRNHVFSASRDAAKVTPLSASDYERMGATPEMGGIVLDMRVSPLLFGYQDLPESDFLQ